MAADLTKYLLGPADVEMVIQPSIRGRAGAGIVLLAGLTLA